MNIPRIDVPVARLSGGQRQAIAVARTVTSDADIILLDEPLAAMGAKEGALILDLVARLRAEGRVSIIMIAHNYVHILEACDRVNLIQDGEITFDKPTAETSVEELNEIVVEEYRRARLAAVRSGRPGRSVMARSVIVRAGRRAVPSTGSQFLLEREGQRAVVTEVGATLRSWRVDEREQLDTFEIDELGDGFRGKVLLPWPNRIRDARYVFAGAEHRVAISEPERGNALHGLVLWANWHPLRHSSDDVALGYMLHPQPGYPFTLELEVDVPADRRRARGHAARDQPRRHGGAVRRRLPSLPDARRRAARRRAARAAGPHPRAGGRAAAADGRPGARRGHRVRLPPPPPARAARARHLLRRPRARRRRARSRDARGRGGRAGGDACGWTSTSASSTSTRRRAGVAVEPMTCAPDAFNSGDGLLALAPGASFAGRWGLNTQREVQ